MGAFAHSKRSGETPLGIILMAIIVFVLLSYPLGATASETHKECDQSSYNADQKAYHAVKNRLLNLGYSEKDADAAMSELSEREIRVLGKDPEIITDTGAVAAALVVGGVLASSASKKKKSRSTSSSSSTRTPSKPTVVTKTVEYETIRKDCKACKGKGKKICPICDGTGKSKVKDEWGNPLPCKNCNGTGYLNENCPVCGGKGYTEERHRK